MKIFIIEDEPAIREELVQLLQKYGYQCDSSDDFHHIVQAALSSGANLILLDINLPYQDGFQVCREIRQKSNLPIIVLTSRNSDFDELMSLNIGADDYIAKPYNAQILLARIQKLLARTYEVQDNIVLTHKGLTLNLLKAEISYQGNKKSLTKNELGILRLLMVNKGNIIPRDAIIDCHRTARIGGLNYVARKCKLECRIAKLHRHMAPFNWHGRRNYFSCHNRPCSTKE